jgi:glycosyltransferase involved in cell wall biosynthesis
LLAHIFSRPAVVAVGRLAFQKGFDVLLHAHARLRAAGVDHHVAILGEGERRDELTALVQALGVSDSVFMPGFVTNPYSLMRAARAFVLPSRFEGFGMVVAEALAVGVPVVATDCESGPAEILGEGRYGVVVPVDDVPALERAIGGLLGDHARSRDFAARGPARAATYRTESVTPQWETLLRQFAGPASAA